MKLKFARGPIMWLAACGLAFSAAVAEDFAFLHITDTHFPHDPIAADLMAKAQNAQDLILAPYGVSEKAPAFAIVTGDITEFGIEGWAAYTNSLANSPIPFYGQLGNHDNTWTSLRPQISAAHGGVTFSFDFGGCHFIGVDSSIPQDPRPAIGREALLWIERDLKKFPPGTPLFLFLHHEPNGSQYASDYNCEQLMDLFARRNLALIMAGHTHGSRAFKIGSADGIVGGVGYGGSAGYNVIAVKQGKIYAAHEHLNNTEAGKAVIEKQIPTNAPREVVEILSPAEGASLKSAADFTIKGLLEGSEAAPVKAEVFIDGNLAGAATLRGNAAEFQLPDDLEAGAHALRVVFEMPNSAKHGRSTHFYVKDDESGVLWRTFLDGSSRSTPKVAGGQLYVGANDGKLYCLSADDGKRLWDFQTGGDVLTQPLVVEGDVVFGSGDGHVYKLTPDGELLWKRNAGAPVYGIAAEDDKIYFGTGSGDAFCMGSEDGSIVWKRRVAGYSIETAPALLDGMVCFGAWDRQVHALDSATGAERWSRQGASSSTRTAARYYSPADCAPAVIGGRVYSPDRGFRMAVFTADNGQLESVNSNAVSVAVSPDGDWLCIKQSDGVTRLDAEGEISWTSRVDLGTVPSAPAIGQDDVHVASSAGVLASLNGEDGKIYRRFRLTPGHWVLAAPSVADGVIYASGMDGSVTAMRTRLYPED